MKNKSIIILILAIVVILAIIFAITRGISGGVKTVASDDGVFSLTIPLSALPEGMVADDISVKSLDPKEYFGVEQEDDLVNLYQIEPTGIQFNEPLPISLKTETIVDEDGNVVIPLTMLTVDGVPEAIDNMQVGWDEENTLVTGTLSHFSVIRSDRIGLFRVSFVPGYSQTVPAINSIDYRLVIVPQAVVRSASHRDMNDEYIPGKNFIYIEPNSQIIINKPSPFASKTKITTKGALSPDEVLVDTSTTTAEDGYIYETWFNCNKTGEGVIKSGYFGLSYTLTSEHIFPEHPDRNWVRKYDEITGFKPVPSEITCEEAEFEFLGNLYTIDCGNGVVISGYYKADQETHELITDSQGNNIDGDTGQPVLCP